MNEYKGSASAVLSKAFENEGFLEEIYNARSSVRNEVRIVLIGKTGSGKSATANSLLGENRFESRIGGDSVTSECQAARTVINGRPVLIVDTPGLFDTKMSADQTTKEIMKCVTLTSPGIHAVIFVTRIGRFTDEERETVDHFKMIFGEDLMKYMMVVFTGEDNLEYDNVSLSEYIEGSPAELRRTVQECRGHTLAVNNKASGPEKDHFKTQLMDEIDKIVTTNEGSCYTTTMYKKAVTLMKKRKEDEEEKHAVQEKIEQAFKKKLEKQEERRHALGRRLESLQINMETQRKQHIRETSSLQSAIESRHLEVKKMSGDLQRRQQEMQEQLRQKERQTQEQLEELRIFYQFPTQGVLHRHVICDGCDGPVYGVRYKCCVCFDYDLCVGCKVRNLHGEHEMWKIRTPLWTLQQMGELHPYILCDGCDGPVYGVRYKCWECDDYDLCSKCQAENKHSRHRMWAITEPITGQGVFHPHVVCDGCDELVFGVRYKCTACPDYDLCSDCQAQNLHRGHSMRAITEPQLYFRS